MKTFVCECGATVSNNADACPKCGKRFGKSSETFKCRSCGATLYKEDHYITEVTETASEPSSVTMVNNSYGVINSSGGNPILNVSQNKCPNCGEPNPFMSKTELGFRGIVHDICVYVGAGGIAISFVGPVMLFFNPPANPNNPYENVPADPNYLWLMLLCIPFILLLKYGRRKALKL